MGSGGACGTESSRLVDVRSATAVAWQAHRCTCVRLALGSTGVELAT